MAKRKVATDVGSPIIASGPPSKKRRAAADSQTKIRQIADAEVDEEALDRTELEEKTVWNDALVVRDEASDNVVRIPRPIFKLREAGEELGAVAKYDHGALKYKQIVEITHGEPFVLTPMRVHEGPLAGRTVLVLEPPVQPFRFLDLPPELRNVIYGYVLDTPAETAMTCYKPSGKPRRPVRRSFVPGTYSRRGGRSGSGRSWDTTNGRWLGDGPSSFSLLSVSKFVLQETAAIAYGNTKFTFFHIGELNVFLTSIGAMRKYLRSISIGHGGYRNTKARPAFNMLRDARDLHIISLEHFIVCPSYYCDRSITCERLIADIRPLLQALHNAKTNLDSDSEDRRSVLDLIKLRHAPGKCYMCAREPKGQCARTNVRDTFCNTHCDELEEHNADVQRKLRGLIAKALGISAE